MKLFLNIAGVLLALGTVVFLIMGVWTDDSRFSMTAVILFSAAGVALVVASCLPRALTHAERCSGC